MIKKFVNLCCAVVVFNVPPVFNEDPCGYSLFIHCKWHLVFTSKITSPLLANIQCFSCAVQTQTCTFWAELRCHLSCTREGDYNTEMSHEHQLGVYRNELTILCKIRK